MASLVNSGRSLTNRSLAAEMSLEMEEEQLASQEREDVLGSFRRIALWRPGRQEKEPQQDSSGDWPEKGGGWGKSQTR